ncbi:hypothetical protein DCAR_0729400 [Daucus carota subsp. sativus]|uniref:Uncharacterized protein n=1 Tax=Daucus carota subsp. sativus TaxID=79200 RepID=A0AAF0XNC3_DAUCS|nr:hypothetical protein DCAR_0729400 [Daucus carota subsp. sativus]
MQLITVEPWVFCWCIYDVTDESCVNNIRNWIRYIEQHASDNVHKILVGNKADMDESKRGSRLKFIDNHLKQQKFLGSWE